MKRRWTYAPLWVNVVYGALEWLDYKLVSPVSSKLANWRFDLLDAFCKCRKCEAREQGRREQQAQREQQEQQERLRRR